MCGEWEGKRPRWLTQKFIAGQAQSSERNYTQLRTDRFRIVRSSGYFETFAVFFSSLRLGHLPCASQVSPARPAFPSLAPAKREGEVPKRLQHW